jgi:23S rRNA (adenine2030-N6)-methyltransferase
MNYRHIYHAGSFADVMKHFILTLILQKLCQKPSPFCVLDTHAGIGMYNLESEAAKKTLEHEGGINALIKVKGIADIFIPYLNAVRSFGHIESNETSVTLYPGSPYIARHFLRGQDRLLLSELHPEDARTLRQSFAGDRQVHIHNQDAFISLKALLPPHEHRGLILIDPPFEKDKEFEALIAGIRTACKRFPNGIYSVWFPIKNRTPIVRFYEMFIEAGIPKALAAEFLIFPDDTRDRLNGCGMLIVNPPWQIDSELRMALPKLLSYLNHADTGSTHVKWLAGE